MTQSKTCYIDCTGTFTSGQNTGIQRVVRSIVARSAKLSGLRGYSFVPVISVGSELYAIPEQFDKSYYLTRCTNRLLGSCWNLLERVFVSGKQQAVTAPEGPAASKAAPETAAEKGALSQSALDCCRKALPFFLRVPPFLDTLTSGGRRVTLQPGDIFFMADSFWNVNTLNAAIKAKQRGAKNVLLMYDIIPISHPQFFDRTTWFLFQDYFPKYLELADGMIGISRFTMTEVAKQCQVLGMAAPPLDYSHLGADFAGVTGAGAGSAAQPATAAPEASFLMVGTIEPRKNHLYILEAFERLWQSGSKLRLHIVGRVGWKSEDILERITGSQYLNRNLFLYGSVSDAEMSRLMRQASAVILASVVEGFGLPLIEAMHMRKRVLASDIPVFREIGADYPVYFPLDDVAALMERITLVAGGAPAGAAPAAGWLSWDEAVETLLEKVVTLAHSKRA